MFKCMTIYRIADSWQGDLQVLKNALSPAPPRSTASAGHRREVSRTGHWRL